MNIEDGLAKKKEELETLQADITSKIAAAAKLKDIVKEYNEKMAIVASLKKVLKKQQRDYDTVINFIKNVDESYLDKVYPLFKDVPPQEAHA
jgi:RNase H-fold protein (predicted Holliday junction resolvase)